MGIFAPPSRRAGAAPPSRTPMPLPLPRADDARAPRADAAHDTLDTSDALADAADAPFVTHAGGAR